MCTGHTAHRHTVYTSHWVLVTLCTCHTGYLSHCAPSHCVPVTSAAVWFSQYINYSINCKTIPEIGKKKLDLKKRDNFLIARIYVLLCRCIYTSLISGQLQSEATLVGLSINQDKTKYMQIKRKGIKDITDKN